MCNRLPWSFVQLNMPANGEEFIVLSMHMDERSRLIAVYSHDISGNGVVVLAWLSMDMWHMYL